MRRFWLVGLLFVVPLAGCVPAALEESDSSTTTTTLAALVAPPMAPTVTVDVFADHCIVNWSAPPEDREVTGWVVSSAVTPRGGTIQHTGGGFPAPLEVTSRRVERSEDLSETLGVVAVNAQGDSPLGVGSCPLIDPPTS
jgi:hypothetical protein